MLHRYNDTYITYMVIYIYNKYNREMRNDMEHGINKLIKKNRFNYLKQHNIFTCPTRQPKDQKPTGSLLLPLRNII